MVHFRLSILILFLSFYAFSTSFAQVYPDKGVDQILKTGISLIIDQKYEDAQALFKQLDKSRKDIPLGKIYLAAVNIAKSYDYNEPFNDKVILENLEDAKELSENLLKSDGTNIWNIYYYALSEGYLAYYKALNENWFDALSSGLNSVSAFEDCLEKHKSFYEALIAIGSYKFWKSKKTEFINWLPFYDDEKDLGIDYLEKAINYSVYNSYLASYSLIWIYIEQEEFIKAIDIAKDALVKYPESRLFKWGLARSYEDVDVIEAIKLYYEILNSYPKNLQSNRINEVTLKHLIAQQLVKLNKTEEALKICNEILSIKGYTKLENERLSSRLDRVTDLKKELTAP